jgi:hypothetical protein
VVRPLRIYLDSSDFSVLSDPARLSDRTLLSTKERLLHWSKSQEVEFFYSPLHIAEMAPTKAEYTPAATARSKLLFELCGPNTFANFLEIIDSEVLTLVRGDAPLDPSRRDGKWFPYDLPDTFLSETKILNMDFLAPHIAKLDRKKRREVERNPSLRTKLLAAVAELADRTKDEAIAEIMTTRSVERMDAEVMREYSLGRLPEIKALAYLKSRLCNPSFLVQQCETNFEDMTFLFDWLRGPSDTFNNSLLETIRVATNWRSHPEYDSIVPTIKQSLTEEGLRGNSLILLKQLSINITEKYGLSLDPLVAISDFIRNAPGLYTYASIAIESSWPSFTNQPRQTKSSDTVDLWHSFYAPYVDVYRTDGFMAPMVKKYSSEFGTSVVGKLTELIDVVEYRLAGVK